MATTQYKSRDARQSEAREALTHAVEQLASSDGFRRWLECRAAFHQYSLANTLLIASQRPDATQVAGYRTWQRLGRQVRKGERGIKIFAPMMLGGRKVTTEAENLATGEVETVEVEAARRVAFRIVHVFDVAQTDGEPLGEVPVRELEGDVPADVRELLDSAAARAGYTVVVEPLRDGLGGYLDRTARRIVLADGRSDAHRYRTLAHELGHAFDPWLAEHPGEYGAQRGDCEAVAEAVAFVVFRRFGIDAGCYSAGYVAGWAQGDAGRLRQVAERIDAACRAILPAAPRLREAEAAA